MRSLHAKRFNAPTLIQAAALPIALKGKDVIGVAQTVSRIDAFMNVIAFNGAIGIRKDSGIWSANTPPSTFSTTPCEEWATATASTDFGADA